jgi:outer membrane protein assembly factor BamB
MKTRTLIFSLFLLLSGIITVHGNADDFDWPRWRGPNGDGISNETDWNPEALAGGPNILWKMDIGVGYSNVVIADNILYTSGSDGVFCLKAESGEKIWQYTFERVTLPQSTPTMDGKFVYALTPEGILLCLKTKNGKLRWKKDLVSKYDVTRPKYSFATSPVIEGDLIILNINLSGIALDKKNGKIVWLSEKYDSSMHYRENDVGTYATPKLYNCDGKRCAIIYNNGGLYTVDIQTGEQLWYYKWIDYEVADPILFDNKVFISSGATAASDDNSQGILLDISGNEPKVLWQNENMKNHFSTCVYVDGYIYGIDGYQGGGPFLCIDAKTGDVMWEKKMKMASLMAADGKLIILEEDGTLRLAEAVPSSYNEISNHNVLEGKRTKRKFWTPPVLYKGKIYCRNFYGDLVCIDVSK